jgi:hypothetical protein
VTSRVHRAAEHARRGDVHPGLTLNLTRRVAMGDPQAPLEHVLAVLDASGLLSDDGWLSPRVHLVSMGDHFDFGGAKEARTAAADGFAFLTWLASHPPAQVTLLLGNHDSARVGELWDFDDQTFARARDEAVAVYAGKKLERDASQEASFLARWPQLPSSELAARDFSAFEAQQRALVEGLLRKGRFRLAAHFSGNVLLTHAGVTGRELAALRAEGQPAGAVARALNDFLDARVAGWASGPLDLAPLHLHGDGRGEGGGLLYHRAALDSDQPGPRRRRFGIGDLPRALTQVIGHVRDKKTLALLALDPGRDRLGALRSLKLNDRGFDYDHGVWREAQMIFLDGGMKDCPPGEYQLLDLDAMQPL